MSKKHYQLDATECICPTCRRRTEIGT